jgi:hypothetical protein
MTSTTETHKKDAASGLVSESKESSSLSGDSLALDREVFSNPPLQRSAYKASKIVPALDYTYPSNEAVEVPITLWWVLFPLFLVFVLPYMMIASIYFYPLQTLPLVAAYITWVYAIDFKAEEKGAWSGGVSLRKAWHIFLLN